MKIAIHQSNGSYSQHWIAYCEEKKIPYKIVNCYDSDIIKILEDCDALMWHHNHANPKDKLFAKQLLYSLETAGKVVYPDQRTTWHFDDKLGQKYLLEAMELPVVPSFAFYSKKEAIKWLSIAEFPLVFKLRGGAGSRNVKLVRNRNEAVKVINKAFGKGFRQYDAWEGIKESFRKYRLGKTPIKEVLKAIVHILYPIQLEKSIGREKGYVYFQKFIPDLQADIRINIVGKNAWGVRRMIRKNDFRASGSGYYDYNPKKIPIELLGKAQTYVGKLQVQSISFDFVEYNHKYFLLEISYAHGAVINQHSNGYWDENLVFHPGKFNPFGWMIEDVISKVNERKNNL